MFVQTQALTFCSRTQTVTLTHTSTEPETARGCAPRRVGPREGRAVGVGLQTWSWDTTSSLPSLLRTQLSLPKAHRPHLRKLPKPFWSSRVPGCSLGIPPARRPPPPAREQLCSKRSPLPGERPSGGRSGPGTTFSPCCLTAEHPDI